MNTTDYSPAKLRIGRRRRQAGATSPVPPTALTLVAAAYQRGEWLEMAFDYAIDIGAYDGQAVFVNDADDTGNVYVAAGAATLISPTSVRVGLIEFESAGGSGITLTAPATTGIVAAGGGPGAPGWAGVTNLELPFGS